MKHNLEGKLVKMNGVIATLQLDATECKISTVKKEACVIFLNGMHQNYQCKLVQSVLARIIYG